MVDACAQKLNEACIDIPWQGFGIPQEFLALASRPEIVAAKGLESSAIAHSVVSWITADSTFSRANMDDITRPKGRNWTSVPRSDLPGAITSNHNKTWA